MRAAMRSHFAGHLSERALAGNLRFFTVCTSFNAFLSLPEGVLKAFVPCDGPGSDGSVLLASFEDPSKLSSLLGNNWWEMTYKRTAKMEVHGPIEFIHAPATGITTFRSAHVRSISEGGRVQWDTEDTSTFRSYKEQMAARAAREEKKAARSKRKADKSGAVEDGGPSSNTK
eukprot:jgi/Mesvir1/2492/Mv14781-RA.1